MVRLLIRWSRLPALQTGVKLKLTATTKIFFELLDIPKDLLKIPFILLLIFSNKVFPDPLPYMYNFLL